MSDIQITQTKSNPGYTSRFGKIIYDTMKHKRLFFVVLPLAILLSLVYSLSLPNVYTCTIKMSPEKLGHSDQEAIAIANTYGVSLTGAALGGIYPRLYPELVNSIEFKTSLLSVKVKRQHDGKVFNYFDYVANHQKYPWWQNLFGTEHIDVVAPVDPFRLTEDQTNVINIINSKIYCSIDRKTSVIAIYVVDQDPLIAATMADSVKTHLQAFITTYYTNKARLDYDYDKKIYADAKSSYIKSRDDYAQFADANREIFLAKTLMKQNELEEEMRFQNKIFNGVTKAMMEAEASIQRETPAFATLQSATVPIVKSGPHRAIIAIKWLFFSFLATFFWVMYKEKDLKILQDIIY